MAFGLPGFSRPASTPLLGIDISPSSVKVVELDDAAGGGVGLRTYAIEQIDKGAVVDGNIEQPEVVAAALTRALSRMGSRTRGAALAMPASAVIAKRIRLPAGLTEEDYELQVESEASNYIQFPIEEVNLDFQILGAVGAEADEVDVLLVASRKEQVEDRVAIAEMCGLQAVVVDVESYAACLAVQYVTDGLPNHAQGEVIAVFDIGSQVTALSVYLDAEIVFEREQAFGGQILTQDLVRLYGLTPEEAELKKKSGDLPAGFQSEVLAPFVDQGAANISRTLQFFFTSTEYTKVDRIYLAGGTSVVPGLLEAVAERTQLPTALLLPFEGMQLGAGVRERQLEVDAPALMTACGLALRRFGS